MKVTPICILCMRFAKVTPLLFLKNIAKHILDDESVTHTCATRVHQIKTLLKSTHSTRRISARLSVLGTRDWRMLDAGGMHAAVQHLEPADWRMLDAGGMHAAVQHLEPAVLGSRTECYKWLLTPI